MYQPLAFVLAMLPRFALTACTCGYSVTDPQDENASLSFMNLLQSDFTAIKDLSQATEWTKQRFNVSAKAGRGVFGKSFLPENVVLTSEMRIEQHDGLTGRSMGLWVRRQITASNTISAAEIDTSRTDMQWGSYRTTMKLSRVFGTCAAFFWYFNDTQEIDMEFLSREFDEANKVFPVNLVIHSASSAQDGYDASKTGTFKVANLKFDPTKDFHEYRFDFLPGRVRFYADGENLGEMDGDNVPSSGGHIILQHWSNGNPKWSGGPPLSDAVILVKSVEAYFNSSGNEDHAQRDKRCGNHGTEKTAVCTVSGTTPLGNNSQMEGPSHDGDNMGNREASQENASHVSKHADLLATVLVVMMMAAWQLTHHT